MAVEISIDPRHRLRFHGAERPSWDGRIAQVVEQLTLNQRVVGSSPTAPTKLILRDKGNPASGHASLSFSSLIGSLRMRMPVAW